MMLKDPTMTLRTPSSYHVDYLSEMNSLARTSFSQKNCQTFSVHFIDRNRWEVLSFLGFYQFNPNIIVNEFHTIIQLIKIIIQSLKKLIISKYFRKRIFTQYEII